MSRPFWKCSCRETAIRTTGNPLWRPPAGGRGSYLTFPQAHSFRLKELKSSPKASSPKAIEMRRNWQRHHKQHVLLPLAKFSFIPTTPQMIAEQEANKLFNCNFNCRTFLGKSNHGHFLKHYLIYFFPPLEFFLFHQYDVPAKSRKHWIDSWLVILVCLNWKLSYFSTSFNACVWNYRNC